MKRLLCVAAILLLSAAPDPRTPYQKAFPSVVLIRTLDGHGTGCYVGPNLLLTAAHVAETATAAELTDGRRMRVSLAKIDKGRDLALLRIERPGIALPLGDEPEPGDALFAIGCGVPFGFNQGYCRLVYDHSYPTVDGGFSGRCIDLSLPVNFGDSGAPVLSNGKIAGMIISVDSGKSQTGFAVSVAEIRGFVHD